jgi:hypothetical protein
VLAPGSSDAVPAGPDGAQPAAHHQTHADPGIAPAAPGVESVTVPSRLTAAGIGRHGLAAIVRLASWQDHRPRRVRLRLYRITARGRRTLLAGVVRPVRRGGTVRVALPASRLRRRVHPGRYELELTFGRDLRHAARPVRHALTVTR